MYWLEYLQRTVRPKNNHPSLLFSPVIGEQDRREKIETRILAA